MNQLKIVFQQWQKWFLFIIALLLQLLYCVRLWLPSLNKPIWTDEAVGVVSSAVQTPIHLLFWNGAPGQASPSPLHFIINNIWFDLWNNTPQVYWDLNFFFRIFPVFYFAIACVSLFLYVSYFFRKKFPQYSFYLSVLVGLAASAYYYTNDFGRYYALENRAYSPWLTLSTIHLLFFWHSFQETFGKKAWFFYGLVCVLMVLNTYVALVQVSFALFIQYISPFLFEKRKKLSEWKKTLTPYLTILSICTFCAFWYFAKVQQMGWTIYFPMYWEALGEVITKSFHHHNVAPLIISMPLFCIVAPYVFRKTPGVIPATVLGWALLLFTLVLFIGCKLKGNLFHSRQFIFLLPTMTLFYALGLFLLFKIISQFLNRFLKIKKNIQPVYLLCVWAFVEILRIPGFAQTIHKDWYFWEKFNVYKKTENPECYKPIDGNAEQLIILNDLCRGRKLN